MDNFFKNKLKKMDKKETGIYYKIPTDLKQRLDVALTIKGLTYKEYFVKLIEKDLKKKYFKT